MKKLLVIITVMLFANNIFAQQNQMQTPPQQRTMQERMDRSHQQGNPAAYACPKCFEVSKGEGNCSKCNVPKMQLGSYYCEKCMKSTGTKADNCSSCKGATTQMTRKYCAAKGGTPLKEHRNHQENGERREQKRGDNNIEKSN